MHMYAQNQTPFAYVIITCMGLYTMPRVARHENMTNRLRGI